MRTGGGIGIPMPAAGLGTVAAADQIEQTLAEFDVMGTVVDAVFAGKIVHKYTSN